MTDKTKHTRRGVESTLPENLEHNARSFERAANAYATAVKHIRSAKALLSFDDDGRLPVEPDSWVWQNLQIAIKSLSYDEAQHRATAAKYRARAEGGAL